MNPSPSPRIVITGLGARTPLGATMADNWRALLARRTAPAPITRFDLGGLSCQVGGTVPDADAAAGGLATSFALSALREAIAESGVGVATLGLLTGSNFGEADRTPDDHGEVARRLVRALGLGGPAASLSLSCASGAAALAVAADWIRGGRAEAVAVVGVDALSICSWSGLCSLRTMARDGVVKPFDAARGGTVFAEGAAALILESDASAARRGAAVLAELRGWATGNNGFHLTAPPARAAGSHRVLRDALEAAGATPAEVAFVTAHATATKANDLTEAQALEDLFGERLATLPVTALKAAAGHLLGAAGTFEAAATVLALRAQTVPPIAHTPSTDPALPVLDLVTETPRTISGGLALADSAGFGGCNAALALATPTAPSPLQPFNSSTLQPFNSSTLPPRIVLCSSGFVSALGIGAEEAAATWAEGESACFPNPGPAAPADVADDTAGVVPPFDPDALLPTAKAYLDRQSLLAMAAAALALRGAPAHRPAGDRCGLALGTAWGAAETLARFYDDCRVKGPRLVKPMLFPHTYANAAASLVAIEWELRGFHANFAGGPNASSFALAAARDALLRHAADAVLAGGAEALAPARWSAEAAGEGRLPPGEGAALFMLMRAADLREGDAPLACLAGAGFAGGNDLAAAARAALAEAHLAPASVARLYLGPGLTAPAPFAQSGCDCRVAEEMTGACGGASAAVQIACALLEPLAAPALVLTSDAAGTCVALALTPWNA